MKCSSSVAVICCVLFLLWQVYLKLWFKAFSFVIITIYTWLLRQEFFLIHYLKSGMNAFASALARWINKMTRLLQYLHLLFCVSGFITDMLTDYFKSGYWGEKLLCISVLYKSWVITLKGKQQHVKYWINTLHVQWQF